MLRVSSKTDPKKLATAIVQFLKNNEQKEVVLQAIGAGAVNQAVKGVAAAQSLAAPQGRLLKTMPYFQDVQIDERSVTAICLRVSN